MLRFLDFLKPARMVVAAYGAEAVASARQMREGGAKYPAIAEATGIAKLDLHSILPIAPKKIKNTRPRVSEIDKAEFVRLRQQGRTYAQIAEATGHSRQAVSRHCQVLLDGWEAQELTHRALSKARVTLIGDRHAERNNQILELRRIGLSYPAIATQVGCNYGVVSYVCQFKTSGRTDFMSLEQESYLLCWQAEMSARRLRSALGALRNVHDDFRPCQEVHDAVADYLRSAERAASERGHHYKWLTGGKKYTSPRATDGPPESEIL